MYTPKVFRSFAKPLRRSTTVGIAQRVSASNVIVNTGSSPIFRNLFQLVSGPEYEIMIPRPYYALYMYCATLAGAKVKFYDIDVDTKRVDMDSFRRNFSPERTSLVVINSPGNPIGNIVTVDEMRQMYEIVDRQAYVLNDEIYNNTLFYEEFRTPLEALAEHKDITIVTNSFSKGYRMYTKRVGFAILPEELQVNSACDPAAHSAMHRPLLPVRHDRGVT